MRARAATAAMPAVVAAAACLAALGLGRDSGTVSRSPALHPSAAAAMITPGRLPGCSTATAPAPRLASPSATLEPVPGTPFGVVVTSGGQWSFVSLTSLGSVGVFRAGRPAGPSLVAQVHTGGQPYGEALTPGGRYLLVADGGSGAVVISVSRAERAESGAVLGTLSSFGPGDGAIEVAVSPDGRFAFVSLEDTSSVAVYNLPEALTSDFSVKDFMGLIPVGNDPVGMAVSPGGRWLYAASEFPDSGAVAGPSALGGTLTVISMARAETHPAASVAGSVAAGCGPVRVITSPDGSVVWVTARESDRLLAFSAARLRADPAHSLIASVGVGEEPVGLALAGHGRCIVVADSNRSSVGGATSSLAVVDVAAALAGRPALLGYIQAGGFPREMALETTGGALLVTNFGSRQLEAVGLADLPCATGSRGAWGYAAMSGDHDRQRPGPGRA